MRKFASDFKLKKSLTTFVEEQGQVKAEIKVEEKTTEYIPEVVQPKVVQPVVEIKPAEPEVVMPP